MAEDKKVIGQIVEIQLSQLEVDWDWNARKRPTILDPQTNKRVIPSAGTDEMAEGDEGFAGLKASIKLTGQKEPVTVRANPKANAKRPYSVVAGFSRCEAIEMNAQEDGNPMPTVKCVIKQLTEAEARQENLRENMGGRRGLSAPDTLYGLQKLRALEKEKPAAQIAIAIGKSVAYVTTLCNIADSAKSPKLLDMWRETAIKVPYKRMAQIVKLESAEAQEKSFNDTVAAKSANASSNTPTTGAHAWVGSAVKRAQELGHKIGLAAHDGALSLSDSRTFFNDYAQSFVGFKDAPVAPEEPKADATENQKKAYDARVSRYSEVAATYEQNVAMIVEAFKSGYKEGKKGTPLKLEGAPEVTETAAPVADANGSANGSASGSGKGKKKGSKEAHA